MNMKKLNLTLAALVTTAMAASAQGPKVRPEIRPFAGMFIQTGGQRNLFDDAAMVGLQAALELQPSLHLLGTFGWVHANTKYPASNDNVQILQVDVGFELNLVPALGEASLITPFLGVGVGARTYLYEDESLRNQTCHAYYGAIGAEFQLDRAAIRLEGRDNYFCFRSALRGIESKMRNDVGLSLGLAYHFR